MLRQLSLFANKGLALSSLDMPDNLRIERLPTNTTTGNHPIHRWFNFIAGFSPEFVEIVCDHISATESSHPILDPFAGCGTAPLAASLRGMPAVGYEAHPIFERICRAKLVSPRSLSHLPRIESALEEGAATPVSVDSLPVAPHRYLLKLFAQQALEQLLGMKQSLVAHGLMDDSLAFLILSKTLDLSSHSATDGIYKAPTTTKRHAPPAEALRQVMYTITSDLRHLGQMDLSRNVRIYGKSSESMTELSEQTISAVVTSPPYLNNFDYAEMTRMYLYFWEMASSWSEITDRVRRHLIVNTTTALSGHKDRQAEYRNELGADLGRPLDAITTQLTGIKKSKAGKKDYDLVVYPYFAQIKRVLGECFRVMRPGAPFYMMVSDAALYGVHIPAPQILASILEKIGFSRVACQLIRKRGHRWILEKREGSREGLGEYCVAANR
jgi:DNA modification methylase